LLLLLRLREMATHLKARRRRSDRTQASHLFLLQLLRESKVPTAENYASQTKIGKSARSETREKNRENRKRYLQTLRYRKILRKKKRERETGITTNVK